MPVIINVSIMLQLGTNPQISCKEKLQDPSLFPLPSLLTRITCSYKIIKFIQKSVFDNTKFEPKNWIHVI